MQASKLIPMLLVAVMLTGCVSNGNQKQLGGGLLGAGLGALAGSQIGSGKGQLAAVAIGTLAGAYMGSEIGASLDKADRLYAQQAQASANTAAIGQRIAWSNPDSGHYGAVTPTRDGIDQYSGSYCREYQTTVNVGGQEQSAYGTSCRQPDGDWQIIN